MVTLKERYRQITEKIKKDSITKYIFKSNEEIYFIDIKKSENNDDDSSISEEHNIDHETSESVNCCLVPFFKKE